MAPEVHPGSAPARGRGEPQRRSLWKLLLIAGAGFFAICFSRPRVSSSSPGARAQAPRRAPPPGHEQKDASAGWVFAVVAILAVSGIAIHLLLGGYLGHLNRTPPVGDSWQPIARPPGGLVVPVGSFPRLQSSPPQDLAAFRAREEAQLDSYGWVNRTSGTVHIPISVAMDLLVKKGLPVRNATNRGPSSYELQLKRVEGQRPGKEGNQ